MIPMTNTALIQAKERAAAHSTADQLGVTEAAAAHIQRTMAEQPDALGLRVGVTKSGCSGFGYVMDFAQSIEPNDLAFIAKTASGDELLIVCDEASFPIIKGATLDYVINGLSRLLQFNNPNVVDSCGCGESFTIKEEDATHA